MGLINDWQVLISGVFGFIGVWITLYSNARSARNQRNDERAHEREVLRVALREELTIFCDSLRHNRRDRLQGEQPEGANFFFVPLDPMDDVYKSSLPRLGLLSSEEARKTLFAYLSVRAYLDGLFILGGRRHTENDRLLSLPIKHAQTLAQMAGKLESDLERAICALSNDGP